MLLTAVAQHNLHVLPPETYAFRVIDAGPALAELDIEARLLRPSEGVMKLDAGLLLAALRTCREGSMLSVGEVVVLQLNGHAVRLRVAGAHTLSEAVRREAIGYHSYRGMLGSETAVFVTADPGLELRNVVLRPILLPSANCVTVRTSDGEAFEVPALVLRPCIALTRSVRAASPEGGSEATVGMDCCLFDRVLLHLEALALGHPLPSFSLTLVDELSAAAGTLGLRSLADYCASSQNAFVTRLREWAWADIMESNRAGGCLLVVDGMVLDVADWLPEHPGGSTIIPAQSLNLDAARHFELYHHSRESFLYLRHFYVGEVRSEDRGLIPLPLPGPSSDFLRQLDAFTAPFRLVRRQKTFF